MINLDLFWKQSFLIKELKTCCSNGVAPHSEKHKFKVASYRMGMAEKPIR
jgi:hypothetical protein